MRYSRDKAFNYRTFKLCCETLRHIFAESSIILIQFYKSPQQKPEQSALCVHAMEFEHNIDWINAKVLKVENNYSKRLVSEAWFIYSRPNVMNRSDGDKLPQVYHILF